MPTVGRATAVNMNLLISIPADGLTMGHQLSPVLTFQPLPELLLCQVPQYPEHVEEAQGGAGGHQQI